MSWILKRLQSYTDRYLSTKVVFIVDILVSLAASLCTIFLIHVLNHDVMDFDQTTLWFVASLVLSGFFFYLFRTFGIIIRHSTLKQLVRFVYATFSKSFFLAFVYGCSFGFRWLVLALAGLEFPSDAQAGDDSRV